MKRLTIPVIILGFAACIGLASVTDRNVLPDTVLDLMGLATPSFFSSTLDDLPSGGPRQEGNRSLRSVASDSSDLYPTGISSDFFDMAASDDFASAMFASLASGGTTRYGYQTFGFIPGSRNSSHGPHGHSIFSGGTWDQGAGSAGSGGFGGDSIGGGGSGSGIENPNAQRALAGLPMGWGSGSGSGSDSGPGNSGNQDFLDVPVKGGNSDGLPQTRHAYVPPQKDPLLGSPIEEVIPKPDALPDDTTLIANPEPGTLILGGMGLAFIIAARRRRKAQV